MDPERTQPVTLAAMAARLERVEELCEKAADYSMRGYQIAASRSVIPWAAMALALVALLVACVR